MSEKKMGGGANAQHGANGAGKLDPEAETDEFDLANQIKGKNSLQGDDQERVVNQRQAQAEATGKTQSTLEAITGEDTETEDRQSDGGGSDGDGPGLRWASTAVDADEQIRQRAHQIWEEEGRPDGREEEHWSRAEREHREANKG